MKSYKKTPSLQQTQPLRGQSPWTKSHELGREVYARILAVLSDEKDWFLHTKEFEQNEPKKKKQTRLSPEEEKNLIQLIKINREKLPEKFLEAFDLQVDNPECANKALKLLGEFDFLIKDRYWNNVSRIIGVDGKILIFREEITATHQEDNPPVTQAEKKRKEKTVKLNVYQTIYDAIRSQHYTIETEAKNADDYGLYQQEVLDLMEEIEKVGKNIVKDFSFHKRIAELVEETRNAKNYQILAMNLQNLRKIAFNNRSIVRNQLIWANNKLEQRFEEVWKIIAHVSDQLKALEKIKTDHEEILIRFFIQYFDKKNYAWKIYEEDYKYLPKVEPFHSLHKIIRTAVKMEDWREVMQSASEIFNGMRDEHTEKLKGMSE